MNNQIIVKRKAGVLTVISGQPSEQAIRSFFQNKPVTNYVNKETSKVSQCSVINDMLMSQHTVLDTAKKLIKLNLFPANSNKLNYADMTEDDLVKKCVQRINTHIQCSSKRPSNIFAGITIKQK
jgi:hypothetical protein